MKANNSLGSTDKPIESISDDILGIGKYIDGLTGFIKICKTPMTIAIQGDWGSGKTSFMNIIREKIGEDTVTIWFNTWQFSQFNMGNLLTVNLLSSLVNELGTTGNWILKTKESLKLIGNTVLKISNDYIADKTGIDIYKATDADDKNNFVKVVSELKNKFQKCVNEALNDSGKQRIVIFIDDLDRLPPQRAVEVLEILKLFLDCDDCVFVLAIDYAVVCRGISLKYGEDFDAEKGRSFFDKIIQVPFKMPIAHYEVKSYIKQEIEAMGFDTKDIDSYVQLVTGSIGYNPRSMKRLLNSFLLIKMIYSGAHLEYAREQIMLFAILCLQMSYEPIYNLMVRDEEEVFSTELFETLRKKEIQTGSDCIAAFKEKVSSLGLPENTDRILDFMVLFANALTDGDEPFTVWDNAALHSLLSISGTTSSSLSSYSNGINGKGVRYSNTYDAEFSYHNLDEAIEKTNEGCGWNGCKLEKYKLRNQETPVSDFNSLVVSVLSQLYKENSKRFTEIYEDPKKYNLQRLFHGREESGTYSAPRDIPDTEFCFESKNAYNDKVRLLRLVFEAMNLDPQDLQISLKLAHRNTQTEM